MVRVSKSELHKTIYDILATSDLNKLTTKRIRLLCEDKYRVDLTSRRREIDSIVLEYVNMTPDKEAAPKKSQELIQSSNVNTDDATYARQLQAQEWNLRERNHTQWFRDTPVKKEKDKEEKKKNLTATSSTRNSLYPALTEVPGTDQEKDVFTTSVRQAEFGLGTRKKQGSSR